MPVITVPFGAIILDGLYVAVAFLQPAVGAVTLQGLAPTAVVVSNYSPAIPAGSLTLAGLAPSLSRETIAVPLGSLTLAGLAPSFGSSTAVRISQVSVDTLSDSAITPTVRFSQLSVDVLRDSTAPNFVLLSRVSVDVLRDSDPISGAIIIILDGVDHSSDAEVLLEGAEIVDEANERPNTLSLSTRYAGTLEVGMSIIVALGTDTVDHRIFAGTILTVERVPLVNEFDSFQYVAHVTAQDYNWLLNRRSVTAEYAEQSASTVVTGVIGTFTSGFTVLGVEPGLPILEGGIKLVNVKVSDALAQIAQQIGANWDIDYGRDVRFAVTPSGLAPVALTYGTRAEFWDVEVERDQSQIRTRVIVEGQGSTVTADVPAGTTTIPVEDATKFNVGGGTARLGTQVITYTGVVDVPRPDHAITRVESPGVNSQSGIGGNLEGTWYWVVTAVQNGVQSVVSNLSAGLFDLPASSGIAGRVYWADPSAAPGRTYRLYRLNHASANPFNEARFDGDPYPTAGYHAASVFAYLDHNETEDNVVTSEGVLQFVVYDLGDMVGWTDLPSNYGTSGLSGVPASGAGAVLVLQPQGTEIVIRVQTDDAAAQAVVATQEGGDGIHEAVISDSSLDTAACLMRAAVELDDFSAAVVSVRYKTRDLQTRSGRTVNVNLPTTGLLPAVAGDFLIQTVTIRDFDRTEHPGGATTAVYPVRHVTASPVKPTALEDLLRGPFVWTSGPDVPRR